MSPATTLKRRVKMREIAHLAGVGPATVDRVLNNRKHVSVTTRQRVMQAKQALETGAQIVTSARPWRLKVFLPDNAGPSTEFLAACFQEFGIVCFVSIWVHSRLLFEIDNRPLDLHSF
mgnify:CR=1 FL=1